MNSNDIKPGDTVYHVARNHIEPVEVEAFDGFFVTYTKYVGGTSRQRASIYAVEMGQRIADEGEWPVKVHASRR